jgi:pyrroloquinoline quinone (PQQ) biosynthesis protein C
MTSDQHSTPSATITAGTYPTGPRRAALATAVAAALEGRTLLTHPFYQRWEAGLLAPGELADYAAEYRAFEAALPVLLAEVAEGLSSAEEAPAADLVRTNLADELGRPEPHLDLFDRFAEAVGAPSEPTVPGPAARQLVATYRGLVAEGPASALAGLAAYETQASSIAASKADGLRRWYGTPQSGTAFWDVHATMDADHGEWTLDALDALDADPEEIGRAARRAADAWWSLLDEREAAAPASAQLGADH